MCIVDWFRLGQETGDHCWLHHTYVKISRLCTAFCWLEHPSIDTDNLSLPQQANLTFNSLLLWDVGNKLLSLFSLLTEDLCWTIIFFQEIWGKRMSRRATGKTRRVDINTASVDDLAKLNGIGRTKAESIIEARKVRLNINVKNITYVIKY